MEKLAKTFAIFIATVIGTLEEMGVLDRAVNSFWRSYLKNTQPQQLEAAKENEEDEKFVEAAKTDGWTADDMRP